MPRPRTLALALLLVGGVAGAREVDLQYHEVDFNVDLGILQQGNNSALIDATYTFTPAGIDRNDELPSILRRFVTHPSSVYLHLIHNGATRQAVTHIRGGADLEPFGGVVYGKVEAGVGRHLTIFDEPYEYGWYFFSARGEVGVRPLDQLTVGVFYEGEPTIGAVSSSTGTGIHAERSGLEQSFGATTTFVTPNDRLFATFSAFGHIADWKFVGFSPGDTTVRGWGATARLAYNASLTTTLQLRGTLSRDHWVDTRPEDVATNGSHYIGANPDRQVWSVEGAFDFIYWASGRYGFRISAGGGYLQAPPLLFASNTAEISIGGSILVRF